MRDHQRGHVEIGIALVAPSCPVNRRKAQPNDVVVVDDEVGCPNEIETDDERPEQLTYPCGRKRRSKRPNRGSGVAPGSGRIVVLMRPIFI